VKEFNRIDMQKKNKNTTGVAKHKTNTPKQPKTDKSKKTCPACGWELVNSPAGIWCVNPKCEVLDDADNYR
jgi:hypothetical protein